LSGSDSELLQLLEELVNQDSPTTDKVSVDRLQDIVEARAGVPGTLVERLPVAGYGDHLRVGFGEGERQVLVLCHVDTVWPPGEAARRPFSVEDGRALGPGCSDMKGGVALALHVLGLIARSSRRPAARLCFLFTSDEEVGSPTSRALIEREASASEAVLVLESGFPPEGAVKTFRKGWGRYTVRVHGRASHAGADHAAGRSAIKELAQQVLGIESMTDYESGTTLNVGTIAGGSRVNVVPELAEAEVDVRVNSMEAARRMDAALRALRPHGEGLRVEVEGGFNRPPFERSAGVAALYETARGVARELGLELPEVPMGGASDGNFTAALGIPTLDGLGLVGEGAHALDEFVLLEHNESRVRLLEELLLRLGGEPPYSFRQP
jgi:glutamate carboxypeptidase